MKIRDIALARSGDKGNRATLSVARLPLSPERASAISRLFISQLQYLAFANDRFTRDQR